MRTTIVLIIVGLVGLLLLGMYLHSDARLNPQPSKSPSPTTTQTQIIFPKGVEEFIAGETYTLQWTGGPDPTQIFLVDTATLSQGLSVSLVDRIYNVANTGSYRYTFPVNLPGGQYQFEIGDAESPKFSLKPATTAAVNSCAPSDLTTQLSSQGAAGSIYLQLTIQNTSTTPCQIIGNEFIQADFTASNIKLVQQKQPGPSNITLQPNQIIYSLARLPNGPQCSQVDPTTIAFKYQITSNKFVYFTNSQNQTQIQINSCKSPSEITSVDVFGLSTTAINQ